MHPAHALLARIGRLSRALTGVLTGGGPQTIGGSMISLSRAGNAAQARM